VIGRRRVWVFGLTAAILLLAAAAAIASTGTHRYDGKVRVVTGSAPATVNFNTKTSGGHQVVYRFDFDHVPMHCQRPWLGFFHFQSATFRIKNGRFQGHTKFGNPAKVFIAGRFNKERTRATGTLSMVGAIGYYVGCHTGTLGWSAEVTR